MMDPSSLMAVLQTVIGQAGEVAAVSGAEVVKAGALVGAGICMGFGAIGPGVGEGFAAGKACEAIGRAPENAGLLTRTMLIGQAVSESTGIYSLVVSLLMLFVVS